jgi:hypothetical protein
MKSTVFWNVMPYSLVVVNQHFGGIHSLCLQGYRVIKTRNQQEESRKLDSLFNPEGGGRIFLQNVDELLLATCCHIPYSQHYENLNISLGPMGVVQLQECDPGTLK